MTEVRPLAKKEIGRYMPFDEVFDSNDKRRHEIYEAVGDYLMLAYAVDGTIEAPADLLVSSHIGRQLVFSYGECITTVH